MFNTPVFLLLITSWIQFGESLEQSFQAQEVIQISFSEETGIYRDPKVIITRQAIIVPNERDAFIAVYNRQGRFVKKVGTKGEGPGEFVRPMDVQEDAQGHLFVWDGGRVMLHEFDRDWHFVKSIKLHSTNTDQFFIRENGREKTFITIGTVIYKDAYYLGTIRDEQGNPLKTLRPFPAEEQKIVAGYYGALKNNLLAIVYVSAPHFDVYDLNQNTSKSIAYRSPSLNPFQLPKKEPETQAELYKIMRRMRSEPHTSFRSLFFDENQILVCFQRKNDSNASAPYFLNGYTLDGAVTIKSMDVPGEMTYLQDGKMILKEYSDEEHGSLFLRNYTKKR